MANRGIFKSNNTKSRSKSNSLTPLDPASTILEDDLEDERFKYIPRHEFAPVTLLPSDAPPRKSSRYEILDRVLNDGVPKYIIRETTERTTISNGSSSDANLNQLQPAVIRGYTTIPPLLPTLPLSPTYDLSDPSLLEISLYTIDKYVSARAIEKFENERFAHPHPDDLPRTASNTGSSLVSRRPSPKRSRDPVDERTIAGLPLGFKRPVGRPPKKKMKTAGKPMVVIPILGAEPSADKGSTSETSSITEDSDTAKSIEQRDQDVDMADRVSLNILRRPKSYKYGMMAPPRSTSFSSKPDSTQVSPPVPPERAEKTEIRRTETIRSSALASTSPLPARLSTRSDIASYRQPSVLEQAPKQPKHSSQNSVASSQRDSEILQRSPLQRQISALEDEEDQEEYEISHIITHFDTADEGRFYHVAWVGYGEEESTWLKEEEMLEAQEVVGAYLDHLAQNKNDMMEG